jgi:DnaA N-terminal domain
MSPVSDLERHRRVVEEGSNRKRDLAGSARYLAAQEAVEREEWQQSATVEAVRSDLWPAALRRLRGSVSDSTFRLWLEPLDAIGANGDELVIEGPGGILAWTERRYTSLILEALEGSGFSSIRFIPGGEG